MRVALEVESISLRSVKKHNYKSQGRYKTSPFFKKGGTKHDTNSAIHRHIYLPIHRSYHSSSNVIRRYVTARINLVPIPRNNKKNDKKGETACQK